MRTVGSAGALFFLVLAAALGSQAQVTDDTETKALLWRKKSFKAPIFYEGFHQPARCCFSYISRILCVRMKDYFETSSGCSQPGVIFQTKKGRPICANPQDRSVQNCMKSLRLRAVSKELGTRKPD